MDYLTATNILYLATGLVLIKQSDNLLWMFNSWRSPLRHLPGPKSDHLFLGNLLTLLRGQNTNLWEEWTEKYGKTMRYYGFFGSYQLLTIDMRAINHIMTQSKTFFKAERNRQGLARILGQGLLAADYDTHKRQNPAFGQPQIRELVPIFNEKANQLRDILVEQINNNTEGTTIDVLQWLSYATLDIIGIAGFGYEFNSLRDGDEDALSKAFSKVFDTDEDDSLLAKLKGLGARLLGMPTEENLRLRANIETMNRIGSKIVADKKALLLQEEKDGAASKERDILSILIKSNMAQTPEGAKPDQTLTDNEVLGQISTFLAAGHETTSTSTTWALYALTQHPRVQTKLREELQKAQLGDEPSMSDLEKLPYLDQVVREVLRVYPAVPVISRQATKDAVIPVGQSYIDRDGVTRSEIRIQKWDTVRVSILAINRAKDVWGDDALEFRPERWDDLPAAVKDMPGVFGNLMTFIHGHHACIGYRFALVETKALLYSLLRSIEFAIDPEIEIIGKTG
ncbi:cytochrome P450 family protein [Ceratobasidium sp. AG-Ba]|nr:cytochrome P450 family protein [Ceratobasidium sp. AG-Ba]